MTERTQTCKRVREEQSFGSFLLRSVIEWSLLFLPFNLHMRHQEMYNKVWIMTQEHQTEQNKFLSERRGGDNSWSKYSSRSTTWKRSKRVVGFESQQLLGVTSACVSEAGK